MSRRGSVQYRRNLNWPGPRKEKGPRGVNRGSGGNEMPPVRPSSALQLPGTTLKPAFFPARSAAVLLLLLTSFGCTHGGSGAGGGAPAPEVKLTAADMAGFLKTSVSGKRGGTLSDAVFADPKTFNMLIAKETSSTGAVGGMFDGL